MQAISATRKCGLELQLLCRRLLFAPMLFFRKLAARAAGAAVDFDIAKPVPPHPPPLLPGGTAAPGTGASAAPGAGAGAGAAPVGAAAAGGAAAAAGEQSRRGEKSVMTPELARLIINNWEEALRGTANEALPGTVNAHLRAEMADANSPKAAAILLLVRRAVAARQKILVFSGAPP